MEGFIDLREFFLAIKNKWKFIASLMIIFAILSGLLSYFVIDPVYQADTTIMVKTEKVHENAYVSQEQLYVTQRLAITYGEIIKSKAVLKEVIDNLDLDKSYKSLLNSISVSNIEQTQIIQISVKDKSKSDVAKIANEITKVFSKEVVRIADANGIEVIDRAETPKNPIKPNKVLNVMIAAFAGLAIGICIIIVQDVFNNKFKNPQDVEKNIGLPLLGTISFDKDNRRIVCLQDEKSPIAEQYRIIRTNLSFSNLDNNLKVICLTSAMQNEGKSTVASNLAITFGKLGKKVILIDADLRNPSIQKLCKIKKLGGLIDVLTGEKIFEECINKVENIDVLVAGAMPPNPSEVLSSNKMNEFVESLREKYDYIFIDTPPIGIVTDAGIVSKYADAALFVVAYDHVDVSTAKMAKENLVTIDANIIGAIFNKYKSKDSMYNYYYYGEKEGKKRKKKKRKK